MCRQIYGGENPDSKFQQVISRSLPGKFERFRGKYWPIRANVSEIDDMSTRAGHIWVKGRKFNEIWKGGMQQNELAS